MGSYWENKKVVITGAGGFIGSFVARKIASFGAEVHAILAEGGSRERLEGVEGTVKVTHGNLLDPNFAIEIFSSADIVIHLAALKKNAKFHSEHLADVLRENTLLAINVLESIRINSIKNSLLISTSVADSFGDIESPHFGYGGAKRIMEVFAAAYEKQYGLNIYTIRPCNTFGPQDEFGEGAQVIPALIRRLVSGENPLIIKGDPKEKKSFLYVEDLTDAILDVFEFQSRPRLEELLPAEKYTLLEIAEKIKLNAGVSTNIHFDKVLSRHEPTETKISKRMIHGKKDFDTAIKDTVDWYLHQT